VRLVLIKERFKKLNNFIKRHFLKLWFLIFISIFFLNFLLIFFYTKGNLVQTFEYSLNFFFAIESPFIISNIIINIFSYILIFFNWSSLPVIIIQLYYKKKKQKEEFFDDIENLIIAAEFKKLNKEKGIDGITIDDINKILEISKSKVNKLKNI